MGCSSAAMTRSKVVLPQPEGPMKLTKSPLVDGEIDVAQRLNRAAPPSGTSGRARAPRSRARAPSSVSALPCSRAPLPTLGGGHLKTSPHLVEFKTGSRASHTRHRNARPLHRTRRGQFLPLAECAVDRAVRRALHETPMTFLRAHLAVMDRHMPPREREARQAGDLLALERRCNRWPIAGRLR